MIIEIEVPIMGKHYDFWIDENIPLGDVAEEIAELICQKEQCQLQGEMDMLLMWNMQNKAQLLKECTALENGLHTGSRICLA